MKVLFIIFSLLLSLNTVAGVSGRRNKIISLVSEELGEVVRLYKAAPTATSMLRMAELLLEKARLLKETETEKFLALPKKKRLNANNKKYFSKSRKYFLQAQKTAVGILKKYPRFSGRSDVYYIMAFNAKEFNKNAESERYLRLSLKIQSRKEIKQQKLDPALHWQKFIITITIIKELFHSIATDLKSHLIGGGLKTHSI